MNEIESKHYPSTRYQGSKRKILHWINTIVKDFEFDSVLDGFGGTASVSYLFKRLGKSVTYNDALNFNHIIGKAIIENSKTKLTDIDIEKLLAFNNEKNKSRFIEKTFKGIYYLDEENKWLDNIINELNTVELTRYLKLNEYKKALAHYAIFQSCLIKRPFNLFHRRNLSLRTNVGIERSFGNKISWDRPFEVYFRKFAKEANSFIFNNGKQCHSLNQSIFSIDNENICYDLIYLDPPYFKKKGSNETSDYLRCYHFLEGISKYECWPELIDENTINKRFHKNYLADEFNTKNILLSFERIFEKFQDSIIVVSYKYGGTPSIEQLERLLKKFKKRTCKKSVHYKYALNHQNGDMKFNREYLIIGQ